jgi:hypothetical protein
MPNEAGVRNVPWQTYLTTVDALETLTGYDLLALLPDDVEAAVEAGLKPPLGVVGGPYTATEGGAAVTMSAAGSLDPNGTIVMYAWDFGDGATATGATVAHAYSQDGSYAVRLVVTDNDGLTDTVVTTAQVANVAPMIVGSLAGATLRAGDTYTATGAFIDPDADAWTATVDYGDGGGVAPLSLAGTAFALSHAYVSPGSFTVTVRILDGLASATASALVTVTDPPPPPPTPSEALRTAIGLVDGLVAHHKLGRATGGVINAEFALARLALDRDRPSSAAGALRAVIAELNLLVRLGLLSAVDAQPMRTLVDGILHSLSP